MTNTAGGGQDDPAKQFMISIDKIMISMDPMGIIMISMDQIMISILAQIQAPGLQN